MTFFTTGTTFFVSYIQPSSLNSDLKNRRTCTSSRKVATHQDVHS